MNEIPALDRAVDGYRAGISEMVLVGPPGTGKTRAVLDVWLVPAINDGSPSGVLGTSFTKAAAGEMRGRLEQATGLDPETLRGVCSTIHAECWRLSKAAGDNRQIYGTSKKASAEPTDDLGHLLTPRSDARTEAMRLWDIVRHRYPSDCAKMPIETLLGRLNDRRRFPDWQLAAEVRGYEADKEAIQQIDYTDMLLNARDLGGPSRRLLVVDEAQDLSPLQIQIVRRWAQHADQLVWAGDPDQGIFLFAGADGQHLTEMLRDGVHARRLERSWRVPRKIHRLARSIIVRNSNRVDANYSPADRDGAVNEVDHVGAAATLAYRCCYETETGDASSAFILGRTAADLAPYAAWLAEHGIPFANERGGSPLKQGKLIAMLQALWGLQGGLRIDPAHARALVDLLPAKKTYGFFSGTKKTAKATIALAQKEGRFLDQVDITTCGVNVETVIEGTLATALKRINRFEDCGMLLQIVKALGRKGITEPPRITLTTVHCSKGREADVVIVDLNAAFPVRKEIEGSRGGEDGERRVLYVAITRAKRILCLVRAKRADWGEMLGLFGK